MPGVERVIDCAALGPSAGARRDGHRKGRRCAGDRGGQGGQGAECCDGYLSDLVGSGVTDARGHLPMTQYDGDAHPIGSIHPVATRVEAQNSPAPLA